MIHLVDVALFVDIFFECLQPGTSRPLQKVGGGNQLFLGTQFSPEKSLKQMLGHEYKTLHLILKPRISQYVYRTWLERAVTPLKKERSDEVQQDWNPKMCSELTFCVVTSNGNAVQQVSLSLMLTIKILRCSESTEMEKVTRGDFHCWSKRPMSPLRCWSLTVALTVLFASSTKYSKDIAHKNDLKVLTDIVYNSVS